MSRNRSHARRRHTRLAMFLSADALTVAGLGANAHGRPLRGLAVVLTCLTTLAACQNDAQTGALLGAGIGALAGQAIGGDTEGTVIGAAAGAGLGYIIGNESDKAREPRYRGHPDD